VFEDISAKQNSEGAIAASVEDIRGGPINRKNLQKYRDKFQLAEPRVYGGWTTCFRIETADGYDIVLDCGSGFRNCANDIVRKWGDDESRELFIFGSHAHFDHTEGFDQAAVCFDPRNKIHVSADRQYLQALDQNLGIFSHHIDINLKGIQTPLNYEYLGKQFCRCNVLNNFLSEGLESKVNVFTGFCAAAKPGLPVFAKYTFYVCFRNLPG
jgi:metal-dependent hydrolase (beta-lactamase superfamily II)